MVFFSAAAIQAEKPGKPQRKIGWQCVQRVGSACPTAAFAGENRIVHPRKKYRKNIRVFFPNVTKVCAAKHLLQL